MSFIIDDDSHELTIEELLQLILDQLKIMNAYNILGHDCEINIEDTKDD